MAHFIIGSDIGGTFTDIVLFDVTSGRIHVEKVLTTPDNPSRGIINGIKRFKKSIAEIPRQCHQFIHATTLVSNAVLERKGNPTALLCTRGFPHLLAARRHQRSSVYELFIDPPAPLIDQRQIYEITERSYSDGRVLTPVNEDEVRNLVQRLRATGGVESLAVAFLHSYANKDNEETTGRIILEEWPDVALSLSSSVLPELREFERTSTTVINAYVKPLIKTYLEELEEGLSKEGILSPIYIMMCNGGLASVDTASTFPVRVVESGPVAGTIIGRAYAQMVGLAEVLTFDMGGTTAKACLIRDGALPLTSELEIARSERFLKGSGFPTAMPAVDLVEVGAGGGSIAKVNNLGLIQVGPESAGAVPGPMCYGQGGVEPTVTDADLILGYLNPDYFVGGEIKLDVDAAKKGIVDLAKQLDRDPLSTAWTIHDAVNEYMTGAVRMHVVEKGGDPTRAVLVALGGAGPVHAYNLSHKIGIGKILIPARAGVLSALGLLVTPPAFDLTWTYRTPIHRLDQTDMALTFTKMETEIETLLRTVDPVGAMSFRRTADCKYTGQGYTVPVPVPHDLKPDSLSILLQQNFAKAYKKIYGYFYDDVPAEIITLKVSGSVPGHVVDLKQFSSGSDSAKKTASMPKGVREAFSPKYQKMIPSTVYERYSLNPGVKLEGPCIIEERESTVIVDEGGSVEIDQYGCLDITVKS